MFSVKNRGRENVSCCCFLSLVSGKNYELFSNFGDCSDV